MNLYFMGNGIALEENDPSVGDDTRRPLSPKGIKRTRKIAKGVRRLGISFDVLLSSPLARASNRRYRRRGARRASPDRRNP